MSEYTSVPVATGPDAPRLGSAITDVFETPVRQDTAVPSFDAPAESPHSWLRATAATFRDHILASGAVLIRGLPMQGPTDLIAARDALGVGVHHPVEDFTLRDGFGDDVVSPIRWPDDRILCPFQENSFNLTFPSVVLTACVTPPDSGGQHSLSDARQLADHLPAPLAHRIRSGGWTLTRVFYEGFGISWRDAYSVADRDELEQVFEAEGIEARWLPHGTLHTSRHRPGVIEHAATGEECWFNQIAFLNAGSLDPNERAIMAKAFGADLPMNTYFGDGSPLSEEDLTAVQDAYVAVSCDVPWQRGDLLIVDNVKIAQGRAPLEGSPEFLVTFGSEMPRPR